MNVQIAPLITVQKNTMKGVIILRVPMDVNVLPALREMKAIVKVMN